MGIVGVLLVDLLGRLLRVEVLTVVVPSLPSDPPVAVLSPSVPPASSAPITGRVIFVTVAVTTDKEFDDARPRVISKSRVSSRTVTSRRSAFEDLLAGALAVERDRLALYGIAVLVKRPDDADVARTLVVENLSLENDRSLPVTHGQRAAPAFVVDETDVVRHLDRLVGIKDRSLKELVVRLRERIDDPTADVEGLVAGVTQHGPLDVGFARVEPLELDKDESLPSVFGSSIRSLLDG